MLFLAMYDLTFKLFAQLEETNKSYDYYLEELHKSIIHFDHIAALSQFTSNYFKQSLEPVRIQSFGKIHIRYNGANSMVHEKRSIVDSKYNLLSVSRVDPEKGIHNLITCLPMVKQKLGDNFVLNIAGDSTLFNDYIPILKYLSCQLGVANNVQFLGYADAERKKMLFADADLYIFPTICPETGAITILEALASGTPCLVSDMGIGPEYITKEVGCIYNAFDTNDLANKIYYMLTVANFKSETISAYFENNFTWAHSARSFVSQLHKLHIGIS